MAEYARTLEGFFTVMTEVEKDSFEENLEECMGFVRNLVREEVNRLLSEHCPSRLEQLVAASKGGEASFTFDQPPGTALEMPESFLQQLEKDKSRLSR
jgi:hypothetical protein